MGRPFALVFLILSLLPSLYLVWQGRDLPHLGSFHDDAIYFETAKNLSLNQGYVIGSLPWSPAQTKYPPLYPLYLSIAWHIQPQITAALPLALFLNWLWLPVWMAGLYHLLCRSGWQPAPAAISAGLLAFHPEVQLAATRLMSDLMFAALTTWALALSNPLLPGLAYLTRTAALPLFAGLALAELWARQWRRLAVQLAAALVPVAAWALWVGTHKTPALTLVEKYYTDYFAYQWALVPLNTLPNHIYQQLDPWIAAIARTLLLNFGDSFPAVILSRVAAIAALAGVVRLARTNTQTANLHRPYACYALFSSLMMLIWYFPPDTRAMLPLLPLLSLGLWAEANNFAKALPSTTSRRALAAAVALAMVYNATLNLNANGIAVFEAERKLQAQTAQAYQWVRQNLPRHKTFFAVDDPAFYLYTGNKALRLPQLNEILTRNAAGEFQPSPAMAEAFHHYHLDCLFLSQKHFDPNPNFKLRFHPGSTGLKTVYRSPTELIACR
jgi:hypothetical protein